MTEARKEYLTITRCTVSGDKAKPTGDAMQVMINPSSLSHAHSISYNGERRGEIEQGRTSVESKFAGIGPEKVSFSLVFDSSGAVPGPKISVPDEIERLKSLVYDYDGKTHEPNVVRLTWGALQSFEGRMTSLSVDYTVFRPSGEPVRAKIAIEFTSFMTHLQANLRARRNSPDMTHEVVVLDGDTLPLLCERIYGDSSHYREVAEANGLTTFRRLQPGTHLSFKPLT